MKKTSLWIVSGLTLALILGACAGGNGQTGTPQNTRPASLPEMSTNTSSNSPQATLSPALPEPTTQGSAGLPNTGEVTPPPPAPTPLPSGPRGAQVIPTTGIASLDNLTNWMGLRVADQTGKVVGTASDYILNLCESHIIYIVMNPDPSLGIQNGKLMHIPLEVVTVAGGTIDAAQKVIFLPAQASDLSSAPTIDKQDISNLAWEQTVRDYWGKYTKFTISTQCGTSATAGQGKPIATPKIGLASNVLKATFQGENHQKLGQIVDAVVNPTSGFLRWLVIQLDPSSGNGLVLVPTGALTVKDENANQMGSLLTLIVVDANTLAGAPKRSALPKPEDANWEEQSYAYWSQYVKMSK